MGRVKVTLYRDSALPSASYSPTFREMDFLEKPKVRAHEKYRCSRDVPPSSDSAMVKVTLYRDRNRTGESAATTSAEGAVLPLFTKFTAYESYIYRLLSPKESRGVPGTPSPAAPHKPLLQGFLVCPCCA